VTALGIAITNSGKCFARQEIFNNLFILSVVKANAPPIGGMLELKDGEV
jgi:hypothetical protein